MRNSLDEKRGWPRLLSPATERLPECKVNLRDRKKEREDICGDWAFWVESLRKILGQKATLKWNGRTGKMAQQPLPGFTQETTAAVDMTKNHLNFPFSSVNKHERIIWEDLWRFKTSYLTTIIWMSMRQKTVTTKHIFTLLGSKHANLVQYHYLGALIHRSNFLKKWLLRYAIIYFVCFVCFGKCRTESTIPSMLESGSRNRTKSQNKLTGPHCSSSGVPETGEAHKRGWQVQLNATTSGAFVQPWNLPHRRLPEQRSKR